MHHIITPESIVYQRPVQYYETDRMQIVHHSNYIRSDGRNPCGIHGTKRRSL